MFVSVLISLIRYIFAANSDSSSVISAQEMITELFQQWIELKEDVRTLTLLFSSATTSYAIIRDQTVSDCINGHCDIYYKTNSEITNLGRILEKAEREIEKIKTEVVLLSGNFTELMEMIQGLEDPDVLDLPWTQYKPIYKILRGIRTRELEILLKITRTRKALIRIETYKNKQNMY